MHLEPDWIIHAKFITSQKMLQLQNQSIQVLKVIYGPIRPMHSSYEVAHACSLKDW